MHSATALLLLVAGSNANPLWNILPARQLVTVTDLAVVYQTVTAAAASTTQATESADTTSSSRRGGFRWWNEPEDQSETSSVEPTQTSTSATTTSTPKTTSTPEATTSSQAPTTTSTPAPEPTTTSSKTPTSTAAAPSATATGSSPSNGGKVMIDVINYWRAISNSGDLKWSTQLQANAQKTGDDGDGHIQKHELNAGTYGQVITPGQQTFIAGADGKGDSPFEMSYLAWLCEAPSNPGTNTTAGYGISGTVNQCQVVADNLHITMSGTGHADILKDSDYKTIGCAFSKDASAAADSPWQGLWVCDLGF